jgi:hypothetical protein
MLHVRYTRSSCTTASKVNSKYMAIQYVVGGAAECVGASKAGRSDPIATPPRRDRTEGCRQLSGRKKSRRSVMMTSGSSHAPKWPPLE